VGNDIDPKTREIYVMNNDTQSYIPVFAPDQGQLKARRGISTESADSGLADEKRVCST
jgi:hypothetical protein